MSKFHFQVDPLSNQLKFQQLIDAVIDAISRNLLEMGDILPSVNQLCHESKLSRDTVFKAYAELKDRGIVESVSKQGIFHCKGNHQGFPVSWILLRPIRKYFTDHSGIIFLKI
ncbi:MAG: GntR family transcriptional regulator [Mangrovibacterium sp.]